MMRMNEKSVVRYLFAIAAFALLACGPSYSSRYRGAPVAPMATPAVPGGKASFVFIAALKGGGFVAYARPAGYYRRDKASVGSLVVYDGKATLVREIPLRGVRPAETVAALRVVPGSSLVALDVSEGSYSSPRLELLDLEAGESVGPLAFEALKRPNTAWRLERREAVEAWAAGAARFIVLGVDKTLRAGDVESGRVAWELKAVAGFAPSPDGDRVAVSFERAGAVAPQMVIVDARDGQERRRVTRDGAAFPPSAIEWSRDGKTIAFDERGVVQARRYRVDVESGVATPLPETPAPKPRGRSYRPAYSTHQNPNDTFVLPGTGGLKLDYGVWSEIGVIHADGRAGAKFRLPNEVLRCRASETGCAILEDGRLAIPGGSAGVFLLSLGIPPPPASAGPALALNVAALKTRLSEERARAEERAKVRAQLAAAESDRTGRKLVELFSDPTVGAPARKRFASKLRWLAAKDLVALPAQDEIAKLVPESFKHEGVPRLVKTRKALGRTGPIDAAIVEILRARAREFGGGGRVVFFSDGEKLVAELGADDAVVDLLPRLVDRAAAETAAEFGDSGALNRLKTLLAKQKASGPLAKAIAAAKKEIDGRLLRLGKEARQRAAEDARPIPGNLVGLAKSFFRGSSTRRQRIADAIGKTFAREDVERLAPHLPKMDRTALEGAVRTAGIVYLNTGDKNLGRTMFRALTERGDELAASGNTLGGLFLHVVAHDSSARLYDSFSRNPPAAINIPYGMGASPEMIRMAGALNRLRSSMMNIPSELRAHSPRLDELVRSVPAGQRKVAEALVSIARIFAPRY